jgi:hypothetical protein
LGDESLLSSLPSLTRLSLSAHSYCELSFSRQLSTLRALQSLHLAVYQDAGSNGRGGRLLLPFGTGEEMRGAMPALEDLDLTAAEIEPADVLDVFYPSAATHEGSETEQGGLGNEEQGQGTGTGGGGGGGERSPPRDPLRQPPPLTPRKGGRT